MTFSSRCLLRAPCNKRDGAECSKLCASFIAMHGLNGTGGRVNAANVPDAYRLLLLATSPAREGQPEAYGLAAAYSATFTRQFGPDAEGQTQIKSLYLYSREPGTGKTTTAAALLNEYLTVHYIGSIKRGLQPLERPAFFLDVNEWQTLYNLAVMTDDETDMERFKAEMRTAMTTPFVVLDDIGVRDCSAAFRGYLHGVINHRVANALPSVYTSNVPMRELDVLYDKRLSDRVREQCPEIAFKGESKRGMRKT